MNRLDELFQNKKENILSIFITAGYPNLNDTASIVQAIANSGADFIELGIPFSDPLADGPTIQKSSEVALENGMTLPMIFEQVEEIRKSVNIPILLMGYLNPVLQYGIERFAEKCNSVGVDGIIVPDLPMKEFMKDYKSVFESNNLKNIFLVTPQTSEERVRYIDENSNSFIYLVSTASTTGVKSGIAGAEDYLKRIQSMNLKSPTVVGFNIADKASFSLACKYANGAIIGSAFVKAVTGKTSDEVEGAAKGFVRSVLD